MEPTIRHRSSVIIGIALVVITLATLATAQNASDGTVTINGGRNAIFVKPPTFSTLNYQKFPGNSVLIYSNLGRGDQVYNSISGVGILGKDAGQPLPQAVATAFTPTTDQVVQGVSVGVTYVQGTNGVVVSLNEDSNGIPGKQLASQTFLNLPLFGTCCTLQTIKGKSGIQVKANTQYWVEVRPLAADTYCVWNDNIRGVQGTWANTTGLGWHSSFQVLESLAVSGQ